MKIEIRTLSATEVRDMAGEPIWEKEVSTFPWEYDMNETCLLLAGEVTVTPHTDGGDGAPVTFCAGDRVTFPKGLKCTWVVTQPVRKHYRFF